MLAVRDPAPSAHPEHALPACPSQPPQGICAQLFVLAAVCRGKNAAKRKTWDPFRHRNIGGSPPFCWPTPQMLLFVLHLTFFVKIAFKSHKTAAAHGGQISLPLRRSTFLPKHIAPTCKLMGKVIPTHIKISVIVSCDYVVVLFPGSPLSFLEFFYA